MTIKDLDVSPALQNVLNQMDGTLSDDFKLQWVADHWNEIRIGSKIVN